MREDLLVIIAFGTHDGSSDLAETDSVSPSRTFQSETGNSSGGIFLCFHDEGRAIQVGLGESFANDKFFPDNHVSF